MNEQDVTFDSDGCGLAGTYAEAVQPVAAALLIPGSGRTDRNSDARIPLGRVLRLDVTRALAEALAAQHVSSLRPAPALQRVKVPVLAITGGHDLQVQPDDVAAIGRLVGGPFEGHVVGDLSHLLRPDSDCVGPRGYKRAVRTPVSPEVLGLVTSWVTRHWGTS